MKKSHKNSRENLISKVNQLAPVLAAIATENSFSKAAEKLGVHQSAISHRINLLEEALGFSLFERTTRQIALTEHGRILCAASFEVLACWESAFDKLEKFQTEGAVRLSVSSSLAMKWVLPNLARAQQSGLDIALDVNDRPVDFKTGTVDAAIRFGVGPYPGLHSSFLKKAEITPIASPAFCPPDMALAQLAALPATTFLKDATGESDETDFSWAYYKKNAGLSFDTESRALAFDRADLVLQAAINGMGIGLGRTLLIEDDIAQGFLKPVGPPVAMKSAYWLVCNPDFASTQRYEKLKLWLAQGMPTP